MTRRLVLLALASGLASWSCAQDVGLIDRTQPGLMDKAVFVGGLTVETQEWFMRRTVIDAPYDAGYTFVGETDEVTRIRWDVQRDYLFAYRTHPLVVGTPDEAPVAVFAIKAHVDVFREYNPATGEQTNVLVENATDRPWYERQFIRVDWSKNLVTNFGFYVEQLEQDPVAFYPEDAADENRPLLGVKQEDGTWRDVQDERELMELEEAQYLDVVTKVTVKPELFAWDDGWGNLTFEPACWYYMNYDCAPGTVTVRNAFLRVDAALSRDYEPLAFPDNAIARDPDGTPIRVRWNESGDRERVEDGAGGGEPGGTRDNPGGGGPNDPYAADDSSLARLPFFDKFGYFRTERFGYDPQYGEVESDRVYLINRWNIWGTSRDEATGEPLEYDERTFRPIIYYLSPEFPAHLLPQVRKVAEQWSEALQRTATALGAENVPLLYEIRENTRAVDPETGEVLDRGQVIGDLRYSHLYYVDKPTRVGLLGYGPSAADPLTGEIFAADAYVYGAAIKEYAAQGRDLIRLINGDLDPEELALGENVRAYLHKLKGGGTQLKAPSMAAVHEFADGHRHGAPKPTPAAKQPRPGSKPAWKGRHAWNKPGVERLRRPAGWAGARLAHVRDTALEELLMQDPAILGIKGLGLIGDDADVSQLPAGLRDRVSPTTWASPEHRRRSLARFRGFTQRNMMMAAFYDDAVAGLALELRDEDPDKVHTLLEQKIFQSTSEHEVGHTLGLRHNFEASTDALNYHPRYWELMGNAPAPLAELTQAQKDGKVREYQYSSIMDYGGRFNTDTQGLGYYDKAAIKFGYGQLVEVFDTAVDEPLIEPVAYADGTTERLFTLDEALRDFRHHTSIPGIFGGVDKLGVRRDVPYTERVAALMDADPGSSMEAQLTGQSPWSYVEVPYRFCSDEYVFGTATCHAFDLGADSYEIVADAITRWENYYWFNNFKRDRVFFDEWDYMDAMYWRYFSFIQNAYQNWIFDQWFTADTWEWLRLDPTFWGIEDVDYAKAVDAAATETAGVMEGMRFLMRVLAMPEPGAYMYDFDEGYYWSFAAGPLPICEEDWAYYSEQDCTDTNVSLGEGRWFNSLYDYDSGYYFYERLKWIGSFYDKLLALETLTSPDTYFLGVDTFSAADEWAISMYTSFGPEIQRAFSGMAADRFDLFGGGIEEDTWTYVPPDPFLTGQAKTDFDALGKVDPSTSFTIQLYTLWYGMAWLNANYDNTFNDGAKIWLKGSGEGFEPVDPDPALVIEFANPFNNRTYVATRPAGPTAVDPVGWTMLEQAQRYKDEWETAAADPTTPADWLDYYRYRVTSLVESIEVVRGLYDLYGYLYF